MLINNAKSKKYENYPVKVLQIGEGNFLKAFADYAVQMMNDSSVFNGSVVIMQPNGSERVKTFEKQNSMFTVYERGKYNGEIVDKSEVITSVKECVNPKTDFDKIIDYIKLDSLDIIISNTTEAGIVCDEKCKLSDNPPSSYPAKLTKLLFERYKHFNGDKKKGIYVLPVELIENNGEVLESIVIKYSHLWNLGNEFVNWVMSSCTFCSTLVDRIVTGFPRSNYDEFCKSLGYQDELLTVCEPYFSWIIEDKNDIKNVFPLDKARLNVTWCNNLAMFRERKVKILNGTHTMSVLAAFLAGHNIVREMMNDQLFLEFIKNGVNNEIVPTIDLPKEECVEFANSVFERFDNPFIDHKLLNISLNSVSKYKARCLPSIIEYYNLFGVCPKILAFSLASLICFYSGKYVGDEFVSCRKEEKYTIKDSKDVLDFFEKNKGDELVHKFLSNSDFWDMDLTNLAGFEEEVMKSYNLIKTDGIKSSIEDLLK